MSEQELKKDTRLISLEITDQRRYWDDGSQGKDYKCKANVVLAGQQVELKDVPIPDDLAIQIIGLVERAAVAQITEAMTQAQRALQMRLDGVPQGGLIENKAEESAEG